MADATPTHPLAKAVALAAIVAAAAWFIFTLTADSDPEPITATEAADQLVEYEPPTTARSRRVDRALYRQVHTGMTASEFNALEIRGCEERSSTNVAGYSGQVLACIADDGIANAIFQFQNGKLISKAQYGL